ncbi:hypothetical protein E2C01_085884 [Portunus trituberculatus]|uniref:Uncharacterized protein n=1 Tax=Portunus trituberculatus TaxID=210409 RepID=A0A5B7IZB2_PORTR|nr:hypothetical protein [Portunus trituberculatus]
MVPLYHGVVLPCREVLTRYYLEAGSAMQHNLAVLCSYLVFSNTEEHSATIHKAGNALQHNGIPQNATCNTGTPPQHCLITYYTPTTLSKSPQHFRTSHNTNGNTTPLGNTLECHSATLRLPQHTASSASIMQHTETLLLISSGGKSHVLGGPGVLCVVFQLGVTQSAV